MGSREDRLDALLTALVPSPMAPPDSVRNGAANAPDSTAAPADPHLAPLLEAARDLTQFANARPTAAFTARLGVRILARAEQRRQEAAGMEQANDVATLALDRHMGAPDMMHVRGDAHGWGDVSPRGAWRSAVIAAVALVALGICALTVTLVYGATPGSALYGLHQVEQNVGLNFMDQQGRARAHLQEARHWLDDLRAETSGHADTSAYGATLTAMLGEDAAAAQAIQQMPPGTGRDAQSANLAALRGDERTALRAALPHIGWADRITTTQALASLGMAVPQVTGATVTQAHGLWQVTLHGSGFEPGAVLLIAGAPVGSVTDVTSTSLTAQAPSGLLKTGSVVLGVGNPDGTAATTMATTFVAAPTATPNGGGGGHGNGGGGGHGNGGH